MKIVILLCLVQGISEIPVLGMLYVNYQRETTRVLDCRVGLINEGTESPRCIGASIVVKRTVCNDICIDLLKPVCGSDGKTYSNQCRLNAAACHDHSIQFATAGRCGTSPSVTPSSACPHLLCFALYDPVCGTDGKTYSNSCRLGASNCNGGVTIAHHGSCTGSPVVS